ncbi:MAG TPA: hypothetical protein VG144_05355 [Gaiellaceae bacterium]|nr:hypothetical protein [Gaiellaceae bacterium]
MAGASKTTTNHQEIRTWVEERGGRERGRRPARVDAATRAASRSSFLATE